MSNEKLYLVVHISKLSILKNETRFIDQSHEHKNVKYEDAIGSTNAQCMNAMQPI